MNRSPLSALCHLAPRMLLLFIVAVGCFAIFTPLAPDFPSATVTLDASWPLALNQALAQGLVYGRDIVFTYGPYASIVTRAYHPATAHLMLYGAACIGLCYTIALLWLSRRTPYQWILIYFLFAAGFAEPDALFFSYPLLVGLLCYRVCLPPDAPRSLPLSAASRLGLIILFLPFGLLLLTKGSFLFSCGATSAVCAALFWRQGERGLALLILALPLLTIPLLWIASGQPLGALPGFFVSLGPIISGYSQAMVHEGRDGHIIAFVICAIGLMHWTLRGEQGQRPLALFLALMLAVFLFSAYKAGFVRHDVHGVVAGDALVMTLLLAFFVAETGPTTGVVLLCVLTWWACDEWAIGSSTRSAFRNLTTPYKALAKGWREHRQQPDPLPERYTDYLAAVQAERPTQKREGTMDIYPTDVAYVIASGNRWAPRPVFQSYSAYTPELLSLNAQHLESAAAPDNVLFRMQPIEDRYPSLEEGLSWPALINNYRAEGIDGDFLYLRKHATAPATPAAQTVGRGRYQLGADVPVPTGADPVFARVDLQPTLWGRLQNAAFRYALVKMRVKLADGREKEYRFVPNMARTSFLLSPLVENTAGFCQLAVGDLADLKNQKVASLRLYTEGAAGLSWQSQYTVEWQRIALRPDADPAVMPQCAGIPQPPAP